MTEPASRRSPILVVAALLGGSLAMANPHPPKDWDPADMTRPTGEDDYSRVEKLEDLDAWFRRRVGRFRIEGFHLSLKYPSIPAGVTGMADCVSVGDGPGIECVVAFDDYLKVYQYGRDPLDLKVHFINADNKGIVEAGSGRLKGRTLHHRNRIANTRASPPAERATRIYIPEGDGPIHMIIDNEFNFEAMNRWDLWLTRIAQDEPAAATEPSTAVPAVP
jgi:hypothetical protein